MSNDESGHAGSRFSIAQRVSPEQLLERMEESGALLLLAEPGMGRTTLVTRTLAEASRRGRTTRFEDYATLSPGESIAELESIACELRDDVASASNTVVGIDNLPAGDEYDAEVQTGLLREIVLTGSMVIVSSVPEAQMLAEMFGAAPCYWSCDLTLILSDDTRNCKLYEDYTHGVPTLAVALHKVMSATHSKEAIFANPQYQDAYMDIVTDCLRTGLMSEERVLRATLMLLGSGTFSDVERVLGEVDPDLWKSLSRDVPILDVDVAAEKFCCVGATQVDAIHVAFGFLRDQMVLAAHAIPRVVRLLIERGDVARASAISLMDAEPARCCAMGLAWATRFIDAGEVSTVVEAVNEARTLGKTRYAAYRNAVCALWAAGIDDAHIEERDVLKNLERGALSREVSDAVHARMCIRDGRDLGFIRLRGVRTVLDEELLVWIGAVQRMLRLQLEEAFALLVNEPGRLHVNSVTGFLLATLYMLCCYAMGSAPSNADQRAWDQMAVFLSRSGLRNLHAVHEAVSRSGVILGGRGSVEASYESVLRRSNAQGDRVPHGLFLMLAGMGDLRMGALTRAHVRFEESIRAFAELGLVGPERVVSLLDLMLRFRLGEMEKKANLLACRGASRSVDALISVLYIALFSPRDRASRKIRRSACPQDVHWLANTLGVDYADLSRRFVAALPVMWHEVTRVRAEGIDEWCEQHGSYRVRLPKRVVAQDVKPALPSTVQEEQPEAAVEVRLFGGLEVLVHGEPMDLRRIERRGAKSLLMFLGAMPNHTAKRYTLMESMWPDHDFASANRCVYAATSVLRRKLIEAVGSGSEVDVVVASKADGTVALGSAVACDVEQFEEAVRGALDCEGDDETVVEFCRTVEELYRGNLVVPTRDSMGVVAARSEELNTMFADAMVAGSRAAHALGLKMMACRFARRAHEADSMREDAVRVLVVALCAAGRQVEAERMFEAYVGVVVDRTRMPPSRTLREDVRALFAQMRKNKITRLNPGQLELGFGEQSA